MKPKNRFWRLVLVLAAMTLYACQDEPIQVEPTEQNENYGSEVKALSDQYIFDLCD